MKSDRDEAKLFSYGIVSIYVLGVSLWMLFSENLLNGVTRESIEVVQLKVMGWGFAIVSSGLLYVAMRLYWRSRDRGEWNYRQIARATTDRLNTLERSQQFEVLVSRIALTLQADAVALLLKEDERLIFQTGIGMEEVARAGDEGAIAVGFAGTIAATLQPIYTNILNEPELTRTAIVPEGIRTLLGVPITDRGNLLGVLQVGWKRDRAIPDFDILLLESFAERCAIAIVTDRLQTRNLELRDRLQFQIEKMPFAAIAWDAELRLTQWNSAAERILGWSAAQVTGEPYEIAIAPEARSAFAKIVQQLRQGQIEIQDSAIASRTADERTILCQWYLNPLFAPDGSFQGIQALVQDISERQRLEAELQAVEAERNALFGAMTDVIIVFDAEGRYLKIAPTDPELLYKPASELLGKTLHQVFELSLANRFLQCIRTCIETQQTIQLEYDLSVSDRPRWFEAKVSPIADRRAIWIARDISERKNIEEQLRSYAFSDPLTGLQNRTSFVKHLAEAIENATREETRDPEAMRSPRWAVFLLDLDRFRVIKYSLGHWIAERLLIATARRLEACLRPQDQLARMGGDEFAILLENIDSVFDATRIAERIQSAMRFPFTLDHHEIFSTVNIGIALSNEKYNRPADILRDADTALHHAKKQGQGRHQVFAIEMRSSAVERFQLETDLRRAIERQQFQVYYQPIVSLASRQILSFEALVRWNHPTKGMVSPGEFIPLAEETGAIATIDRWVLLNACQQLVTWQQLYPATNSLTVSVNLSGVNFAQVGTIERIERILHSTGIAGHRVKLEITESAIVENATSAAIVLTRLKSLGVQISIDDFGTGYSSLARLHQLPIDTLKIDRSFVNQMHDLDESSQIVQTIVTLAHILGMDAVAEGVETAQQVELLQTLECDFCQGYFFSKPLDSEAALTLLLSSNLSQEKG